MYFTLNGQPPLPDLPKRIRMPDGTTRTGNISNADYVAAGWSQVPDPPAPNKGYEIGWDGSNWIQVDVHGTLIQAQRFMLAELREQRDLRMETGFTFSGQNVPLDSDFRAKILFNYTYLRDMAPANTRIQIEANDRYYNLNLTQITNLLTAMGNYFKAVQDNFKVLRDLIQAAVTNDLVYAIDLTVGWP